MPGNVLRLDTRRKISCIYVAIRELGSDLLKHELCWMPIAVVRSSITKGIAGGISTFIRALFRRWFLADRVSDVGVPLDLNIPVHRYAMF